MKAEYFDNTDLAGQPIKVDDENIDFDWQGGRPLDGINHQNFAVRWTGWLVAPASSSYTFEAIVDDGA